VIPTNAAVRTAIETLAANLGKAGVKLERESPLLPNFGLFSRLYMRILLSLLAVSFAPEIYAGATTAAAQLRPKTSAWRRSACAALRSAIATG